MHYLDFFSESPKTYIFQKSANKTKFGGFLFLIYIIIMSFISISYILDYAYNDKYKVEYSRHLNFSLNAQYINDIDQSLDIDISFKFRILNQERDSLPEKDFEILYRGVPIKQNEFIKSKLSYLYGLKIYYKCEDKNCKPKITTRFFILEIEYSGFELFHQNDTHPPLQMNENKTFIYRANFNLNYPSTIFLNWEAVKYKEENGVAKIFNLTKKDDKYDYISGYISSSSWILNDDIEDDKGDDLKLLAHVNLRMVNIGYIQYKRKKHGVLDVVSKVGALFSTIKVFFIFILKYYSNSFDNYKLVEKILNKNNTNTKNEKNKKIFHLMEDISDNDNDKDNKLLNKDDIPDNDNKLLIKKDINYEEDSNDDENQEIRKLIKFSFFDFYFNNIYCKKFHKIKQEIINLYNEISCKYLSVDTIIYNQMMLENLFKDYKWNNPSLNSIENNELVIKLKNLFNS